MNTFNNWGYGYNPMNYGYNKPKMPNPTNPLSKEDMALLKQKAPQFSLAVSQIDALKAICTHRDSEGEKLIQNPDGTTTCAICGTTQCLEYHHVYYRSERPDLIDDPNNGIMLCGEFANNCHKGVAHKNKKYWQPILLDEIKKASKF